MTMHVRALETTQTMLRWEDETVFAWVIRFQSVYRKQQKNNCVLPKDALWYYVTGEITREEKMHLNIMLKSSSQHDKGILKLKTEGSKRDWDFDKFVQTISDLMPEQMFKFKVDSDGEPECEWVRFRLKTPLRPSRQSHESMLRILEANKAKTKKKKKKKCTAEEKRRYPGTQKTRTK